MLRSFLARKSIFFHLLVLHGGYDYFQHKPRKSKFDSVKRRAKIKTQDKRILIVGMSESPHLHTWMRGLSESGVVKELWLFPSDFPITKHSIDGVKIKQFPYISPGRFTNASFRLLDLLTHRIWRSYFLYHEIKRIKPTHIHFHETQHGAYLFNSISNHVKQFFFGKLILSTWGSDLILYGKIDSHALKISKVMSWVNLLTSERSEDNLIANKFGYNGEFLAPVYITIGNRNAISIQSPPSERNTVLIKGYQDTHGRALNALTCIEILSKEMDLRKFNFEIFSPSESVKVQAELLHAELGLNIKLLDRLPKSELMKHFSSSRVYIGLAVSDGLSTSMVEAMMHGAFPIQSKNSAAPEFLNHGITGGIVDPWDFLEIVRMLKLALTDDNLVEKASSSNLETLKTKFVWSEGLARIEKIYE